MTQLYLNRVPLVAVLRTDYKGDGTEAGRPMRKLQKLSRWEETVAWTRVARRGWLLDIGCC